MKVVATEYKEPLDKADRLAKTFNTVYGSLVESERLYVGVFYKPYNLYTGRRNEFKDVVVPAFCDRVIDGIPHSFGWRWHGKRAENVIEELKKENLEIK